MSTKSRSISPALHLFLCLLPLAFVLPTARAATFTVSSLADDGSVGTLRTAIADAQASTDVNDTITITAQGTITLTGGELLLSNPSGVAGKTVTITGPGAGALFVSGGHSANSAAGGSRVFHFSGLTVNLSGLAVINGFVNSGTQSAGGVALGGAGILAEGGTLTMDHCVVEDCFVNLAGAFGGGVAGGNAALTLTHCVITSDQVSAFNGGGGGGIGGVLGSLAMTDCTVNFNGESGFGGGIGSLNEPLTLTRCTITGNQTLNTNNGNAYGGGVYSQSGAVTLTDCTVSGNASSTAGDGLYLKFGSATLTGCTVSGNGTGGGLGAPGFVFDGGGLYIMGAGVGVTNCTFTGNSADVGGAIYNLGGTLTLSDSTVARNSGGNAGGTTGAGVFVASGATATVTGTILTGNSTFNGESDVVNHGTLTSGGSNLLGDPNGNGFANGVNHDQTGVSQAQAGVAYTLADNGGPTQTLALTATSPAIDADYADTTPTDQRGAARTVGVRNDIGAYEYGATATPNTPDTFVVTNTHDDGDGSLRRAVNNADADPNAHIVFDSSVFGPGMPRTITLTSGPLAVRQNATINGPGQDLLTVSGNNASRVFEINVSTVDVSANSSTVNVSSLTTEGGTALLGGGIFVSGGALNLTDCTVSGNMASTQGGAGGGIENFGDATLTRCLISGNSAPNGSGGGIDSYISATLTMTDCTIAGNSAARGGGLSNSLGSSSLLSNCTFSGNSATSGGGAYNSGSLFFTDCTFSGNTATAGGGIYNDGANGTAFLVMGAGTMSANAATTGSGLYNDTGTTFFVYSTILAGNTGGANVVNGGTVTSNGSNLIGDPDGNGFTNGANSDQTGVTNPGLGPLRNNGGPTQTMALLAGSPAIDAVLTGDGGTDQRGAARPLGVHNDIGAYEYGALFAIIDAYFVTPDTALTVPAPGVLGNDASDGAALTAAVQTLPAHGTVTLNADGSFTYTPATGFLGTDTFTYQAQEMGGQASVATVTLTVSTLQPPTTTATLAGTQGNNGYYRGPVTVTLTPSDPTSGAGGAITTTYAVDGGTVQTYTGPFAVSGDGSHTVTFSSAGAQSGAGPSGSATFQIDATPPTLTFGAPAPADNASGYTNAPVSVPYTTADATSGTASATPGSPVTFTTEGAHQTQTVTVTDNAGNSAAFITPPVSIDLTPPVTTATSQSTTTGQQVTLTATDALSGVAATNYAVDGGTQTPYAGPFTVRGNGMHTVTFASTDNAGNAETTETLTLTVNIAAPVTTAALSGPQGTGGWFTGPVTVTLAATSQASVVTGTFYSIDGGVQTPYTGPFVVSGDARHAVAYFSTDAAGNTEAANQRPVLIDATPPTTTAAIAGTKNGAGAYVGAATITLSATDTLSGITATAYALDGGASQSYTGGFTLTSPGAHTVTFHSTDKAGNAEATQSVTLTVTPVTAPVLHTFPAGLQMFAVTESYTSGAALSPAPSRLAVWDPALLQYTLSGGDSALTPGRGYWARFAQATDLSNSGTPAPTGQPFPVTLKHGWNMIGDPFPSPVSLGSATVSAGGRTYAGLSDASKAGVVAFTLYGYPAGSTQYQIQSGDAPMQPYRGYWLYAFQGCTLQISTP